MSREPSAMSRFFGTALMAIGVLMAALSGLCTLRFALLGVISMLPGMDDAGNGPMIVVAALVTGLVPFLVGVGLYLAGKALRGPTAQSHSTAPTLIDREEP